MAEGMEEELDMSEIMDVVAMYRCKFCAQTFSTTAELSRHVVSKHALKVRREETEVIFVEHGTSTVQEEEAHNTVTLMLQQENDSKEVGGEVLEVKTESIDMATDPLVQYTEEDLHIGQVDPEEVVAVKGAVYMCGQCEQDFPTMMECKTHLEQDHNVLMSTTEITTFPASMDEVSATYDGPNKISVGIQANTYKKPGRKPKLRPEAKPTEKKVEEVEESRKDDEDEFEDDGLPQDLILEPNRAAEGKRRIRLPKALLDDYHVGRKKYKDRNPRPEPKPEQPAFFCTYKGCSIKCRSEEGLRIHQGCHLLVPIKAEDTTTGEERVGQRHHNFQCTACEATFVEWRACRDHLRTEHGIMADRLQCEQCDFSTDTQTRLKIHERVHKSRRRVLVCGECQQTFLQPAAMRKHMRNVHGIETTHPQLTEPSSHSTSQDDSKSKKRKWFEKQMCDVCQREFSNGKSLKIHMETVHEKMKPYACPHCDHTCARKAMLETHIRIHTGDKPFQCEVCDYAASDHNSLRRHKLRHTGHKPYTCQYCPYSCIQAISLKSHMKNKHPGMKGIHSCDQCQYRTVNQQYYENHMKDHRLGLLAATSDCDPPASKRLRSRPRPLRPPPGYVQMVHRDGNMVNVPVMQMNTQASQVKSAENYIQMIQEDGKTVNVPIMQVSGPDSSSNQQLLFQALTAAAAAANKGSTTTFSVQTSTGQSIQVSEQASNNSHDNNQQQHQHQQQEVYYTVQQHDHNGELQHQQTDSSTDNILYLQASEEQTNTVQQQHEEEGELQQQTDSSTDNILYLQAADEQTNTVIDSSGLQHIVTAIQSSEEPDTEPGTELGQDPTASSSAAAQEYTENTYQICVDSSQTDQPEYELSGEKVVIDDGTEVMVYSDQAEGENVMVFSEDGQTQVALDFHQLAEAGINIEDPSRVITIGQQFVEESVESS